MEAGYIYNERRKFHYFTTAVSLAVLYTAIMAMELEFVLL